MTPIEAIEKLYEGWVEDKNNSFQGNQTLDTYFSEQEKKYIFLSEAIIGITTYDKVLSAKFGKMILDTLIQINNQTTFEYIKDESNNQNYILSCNFIIDWIDWGASIRGAWFNTGAKITPDESLYNIGYDEEYIKITDEFMSWFIGWLNNKEVK